MFEDQPWPLAFVLLFVVVLLRSNATYWAGRGLRHGTARTRLAAHLDRPGVARTEAAVERWGAPLVTVSFLTVGFQTLVNAAAGATRRPLRRYLPANVLGCLAWAAIYTFVGLAVLEAWLGGAGWWWALVALLVAALPIVLSVVLRRREVVPPS